ncbi:hypothetical protein [Klebsiella michiganensis]|uniref:hypothetical protein n=1 Tax=Klebsiella michiganensis TaxID=1134687 RepID=UPI000FEB72C2|nr:hypothetical protein [Klebsiella michiganensis]MDH1764000.1 hypothetical protein [Klebsiella michiganensis]RWT41983.1 hypothetical protein DN619_19205 [Klebsiella michiganensis]
MKELTIAGSSNDEIVQTAQQNDMSIEFVRWFFNKKKADCGEHWFLMLGAMWEGWKGCSIEMDRLAAENVALKNPDNWLSQSDCGYEAAEVATQNGANEEESLRAGMIAIINRIETPATDAYLAGIKADAVKGIYNFNEVDCCVYLDGDVCMLIDAYEASLRGVAE